MPIHMIVKWRRVRWHNHLALQRKQQSAKPSDRQPNGDPQKQAGMPRHSNPLAASGP